MKFCKGGIILLMFLLLLPTVFSYSIEIADGEITISYNDYSISFMPRFVMDSGTVFDYLEIPPSIYKLFWKEQISKNKFKYGVDFADISPNIKDNLKYIVLHRTGSTGLQWDDVRREGNSIIVKNKIRMTTEDIIGSGFIIAKINKTDIVIGNLEPNFIQQGDGNFILIIDPVIIITEAEHLNTSREFVSDIYDEVSELDGVWSEEIYHNEYVRVVFEENLTSESDISVYTRNTQSFNTTIEVYLEDSEEKIVEFEVLLGEDYHLVLLTNMTGTNDTFDLKIVNLESNPNAFLEFDHIIDPPLPYAIADCGDISNAGIYNLTTNISDTKDCLIIKCDDVVIQTRGFTISGDGGLTDYGIDNSLGHNNLTVNGGGFITNFGNAIYTDGNYGNFNNLTLYSNTDDAIYSSADNNIFDNLYIHSNADKGIHLGENSENNIIQNNNIINNVHGIYLYRDTNNNTIKNNDISENSNTGIFFSGSLVPTYIKVYNNSVLNNTITSSGHHGIYYFNAHENIIANNTISSSGQNGVYLSHSSNNTITNNNILNTSISGEYASINIFKSSDNYFEGNFINKSYRYGIWLKSTEAGKDSSHNLFRDMNITDIDSVSVLLETSGGGQALNNTFLNITYNNESADLNSELIREWYYGAFAYDLNNTPINNANLSYYNDENVFQFQLITDSTGYTDTTGIIDYINTNDLKDYYSNYTIVFSRVGCIGNISNMTYNVSANLNNLNHSMQFNCILCVENPANTSWSNWTNNECLPTDSFNQSRSRIEYDANFCGTFENVTHYEYNASGSCNYCNEDINLYNTPLEDCNDVTLEWNVSYYYIDNNYDTCCNVTNISSDCNIFNETLYSNYTQIDDCSILDCLYDATPYLKFFDKRIPLLCEVNKNASYGFLTYVKADDQIIQTNPERILIDRYGEYNTFQSVNGLVNLYYRSSVLRPDRNITVIVEGQNGIFYEEMIVIPTYKDPYQLQDRLFWTWNNAGLIIGAIFMILIIGVLIVILIRRFAGEWRG